MASVASSVEDAIAQKRSSSRASWAQWLDDAMANGARGLHRYGKVPLPWVPCAALSPDGHLSDDPQTVLDNETDVLTSYWQVRDTKPGLGFRDRRCLARLSPEQLRAASLCFSTSTSSAGGGFHPMHFSMIDDTSLEVVAKMLTVIECLGHFPRQLSVITFPLIPKPKGGVRPIGLFSGLFRLWSRARRPLADRWLADNPRPYRACGAHRSPETCVWRQALRGEAASGRSHFAVSFLWDMRKFYEGFCLPLLRDRADALHCDHVLANVCLGAVYLSLFGPLRAPLPARRLRDQRPWCGLYFR